MYNEIYNAQNKWDKDRDYYRAFDVDESFFAQTVYLKSKHRRSLVSNLFSKTAISKLQHLIRTRVGQTHHVTALNDLISGPVGSFL